MRSWTALFVLFVAVAPVRVAPGHTCSAVTQANADASAGAVNVQHDGTPIAGTAAPDISRGFSGIPRSAQPRLTAPQQRILECTYRLAEANADIPYTLFVPSTYDPRKPAPLVVDLHGLNITPLQQILFDGTADFAERYGFIVLAPMGFNLSSWWGSRPGTELAEIDTMTLLKSIREQYAVDSDRIYLMGHSMGGAGTYYLGAKYNDIWAGLAPISGARGIADGTAERYKSVPMLIMHGAKDSIVPPATSRRAAAALQAVGAPHIYLEFPDGDHEFWIRRGAAQMEKVFLFFSLVSKRTTVLPERGADASMDPAALVNSERLALQVPGLAAVVVRSDGPPRVYVSGERRIGKGDPITPADRMHLGSLTKAITATVIGALAEKRLMTLETTIGQTFPELSAKIQPAYRSVSVRQLLTHAAGLPSYGTNQSMQWLLTLKGTPGEQRYAFVEQVLTVPPRFEPGTRHEYSNAGAAAAGAMAERIGGSPYRQLVEQLVFAPLGGKAAFGNPGLAADPQPWGHIRMFSAVVTEVTPANPLYTTPLAIEPAGDLSPSMQDYGRFLQLHLRGLRGRDDALKAATIQDLHRRVAVGWTVLPRDGVESHEHFGSSGAYTAYATIQPSRDIAVVVFTNLGGDQGLRDAVARVARRIATQVATRKSD